jgi:outer membrane lipoprotein LolB
VRLTGDGEGATLLLGNGERRRDPDPAQLLYDELGWWIPVESLRYWALGLPDPALPATWSLDTYGRLASLTQNGWEVRFEAYQVAGTLDLPQKVTITSRDAEVRVIARRWTIERAEAK